jgi:glycosyltransferase involved in cell wall biosynthesis
MFLTTSLPVGGAETLLADLVRRLDRTRFRPEICCLKGRGTLGDVLAREIPVFSGLLHNRLDLAVLRRLVRLLRCRGVRAVVTVGTGDKMFWGRLSAWLAGVPVIVSALHSSGRPHAVQRLNRLLTPITSAFVAVADVHRLNLIASEGLPPGKVRVIRNGVDLDRFGPRSRSEARRRIGLPEDARVAGIVAALRPEKNHEAFLRVAARVLSALPEARFLVVGDGPRRRTLERMSAALGLERMVGFVGERHDIPELLAAMDVVVLSSYTEASPVCLLEAMAAARPVVAPSVGSIAESVNDGETGLLANPGDEPALAARIASLLRDPATAERFGQAGRRLVAARHDVRRMVAGYEALFDELLAVARGRELPADVRP